MMRTLRIVIVVGLMVGACLTAFWIMEQIHNRAWLALAFVLLVGGAFNLGWYARAYCSRDEQRASDRSVGGPKAG